MKLALAAAIALFFAVPVASAGDVPKPLIDAYLQVQTDLASDKMDNVPAQASAIQTAASPLGKDAEALAAAAKKLEGAKDIAAARTAFGEVSEALIAYAEKTKSNLGPEIRVAYCPMVNKPWLQKDQEIKNPYYGKSMLSCGSFRSPK
jgi:Protein of unknown function (DUF3347)